MKYHYTNSDSLFKILESKTLRFGQFKNVNDPKESKDWKFHFYISNPNSKSNFDYDIFKKLSNYILKETKILCFSSDNDIANQDEIEELKKGYGYSRMWAQYARNHSGACLVFDEKELEKAFHLHFENRAKYSGAVEYFNTQFGPNITANGLAISPDGIFYEDLLVKGIEKYMEDHIEKFYKQLFLSKHLNWQDENEFRFIVLGNEDEDYFMPFLNSLKTVIITEDFDKTLLPTLIKRCNELNIQLEWLIWRGWSMHRFPFPTEENQNQEIISLEGISFPVHFAYDSLFVQTCDFKGNTRTLLFDFHNNGAVRLMR